MQSQKPIRPPNWAQKFLAWYCRPELLEDLQGDLNEYFERNLKAKGARHARLIYTFDVLKFFRLYTIRKPEFINLLTHWIMIGSYIKTSGRSILRNKLFSAINIVGLAISMSVGLIMIAMLSDIFTYDKFHEKHSRIYRIISQYQYLENKNDDFFATTSFKAAKKIKESIAGPEDVAILRRDFSGDVQVGEKTIPLSGFWVNESFFNVFSFQLLQGNPTTALKEPFALVLTETSALKLFGETNVLGRIVDRGGKEYTVTGVMKDVPVFSHFKFDMLGSLSTYEELTKENQHVMKWDNMWDTWVYVLMPHDADAKTFKYNLDKLSEQEDKTVQHTHIKLDLQSLDNIMTGENLSNQIGPTLGKNTVRIFLGLTLVVILSACFNYTNLSIARAFGRSKEVGIRKTIGALRSQVVSQFLVESVTIALLALAFSLLLFLIIKPHFISMESSLQELLVLDLSPKLVTIFILFAIIIGIAAGFVPAVSFSRINTIHVFKSLSAVPALKGITMRKVLIVFQYSISIMAITFTTVLYKQYKHFIHYDLGFNTENILNIRLHGNKAELLKKELQELHEVKEISQSGLITSVGNYWSTNMKNPNNPEDSTGVYHNIVDENYLPLHNHTLIAGRNFQPKAVDSVETEVIVNQQVLKRFNIAGQVPEKAIGEVVKIEGKHLTIVGVLKDFEYGRPNNKTGREVVMRYSKDEAKFLNVKILSDDWLSTYAKLETIWKKIDPVHPFEAKFYDEQIEDGYGGLKASMKVGGFLSFLVICIASIGLLGMVIFTTEIRIKEISIRKVLGATEVGLLYLLSRGFLVLLIVSASIALPVTYLFFDKVMFPMIFNHAPLNTGEMMMGTLVVLVLALIMIVSQTLKVARRNPADVLKTE